MPAQTTEPDLEIPLRDAVASQTDKDWSLEFPIQRLPPMPARSSDYYREPWNGIILVSVIVCFLALFTHGAAAEARSTGKKDLIRQAHFTVLLIWTWAGIAAASVVYLLFGGNGEIKRSAHTCYPIPDEVVDRLRNADDQDPDAICSGLRNIDGPDDSTYCVRCLVWRPATRGSMLSSHHCNTCQRCVTGFDHHCGVFGRCITTGNMPCFYALSGMLVAGMLTAGYANSILAQPPGRQGATTTPIPVPPVTQPGGGGLININ